MFGNLTFRNIYNPLFIITLMVKEGVNKWLVLLVVLIALSLVVGLISLNVLYGINNKTELKGSLASSNFITRLHDYKSGCSVSFDSNYNPSCLDNCLEEHYTCLFDSCKKHYGCLGSYGPTTCNNQRSIDDDFCYFENEECEKECSGYNY